MAYMSTSEVFRDLGGLSDPARPLSHRPPRLRKTSEVDEFTTRRRRRA